MEFRELLDESVNKSFDKNVKELIKMGYTPSEDHSGEFATTLFDKKFEVKITLYKDSNEVEITIQPKNDLINKVPEQDRESFGAELEFKNYKEFKKFLK